MRNAWFCLFLRDSLDRMLRLVLRLLRVELLSRRSLVIHADVSVGGELHVRLILLAYASDCGI